MHRYIVKKFLFDKELIEKNEIEEYEYAVEVLFLKFCHLLLFLFMGIVSKTIISTMIFLIAFICLRSRYGVYHARNRTLCFIYSLIMETVLLISLKIDLFSYEFISVFSVILVVYIYYKKRKNLFFLMILEALLVLSENFIGVPIFIAVFYMIFLI